MQSQVKINQALGKAGTIARLNPCDKIPVVAEGSAVLAGSFVFEGTDKENQVIGCSASTSSKTMADIAGVAVMERQQLGLSASNSMAVNEGEEIALVRKGYVYVKSDNASVHGYSVCVNPSTGAIKCAQVTYTSTANTSTGAITTTASGIPEDYIDTGWKVQTGNASGQPCEIFKI